MLVVVEIWVSNNSDGRYDKSLFAHLASSYDKAIEWIKEYGQNWYSKPYKFVMYEVEIDKNRDSENYNNIFQVDTDGNIMP